MALHSSSSGNLIGASSKIDVKKFCENEGNRFNKMVTLSKDVCSISSFCSSGVTYEPGMVVVTDINENGPIFEKIYLIFPYDGEIFILSSSLETVGMEKHFDAHVALCTTNGTCHRLREIPNLAPTLHTVVLYSSTCSDYLVVLK